MQNLLINLSYVFTNKDMFLYIFSFLLLPIQIKQNSYKKFITNNLYKQFITHL